MKVATTEVQKNGIYSMLYHTTEVVKIDYIKRIVTLNTGGWETTTTKRRMNQAFQECDLPYSVNSVKGVWQVWNYRTDKIVAIFESDKITFEF